MPLLDIRNVSKSFGTKVALDDISLEIPEGQIFGLLGPNGAGKTTLIRIINRITIPGGGTVYIVEDDDPTLEMPYRLVCGVHGEDARERTRLNADYTLSVIRDRVKYELIKGNPVPETVTVRLNGEDLVAKLVTTNQMVKRGTTYSADKGTVAYYGVAGAGFDETYGVADGTVCYFGFADDWFCANWNPVKSWSGDSWLLLTPSGEILPG